MSAGQELFSIAGQRVLITGGSGGIGRAMATGFAERGATVVLLDVNKEQVSTPLDTVGHLLHCSHCNPNPKCLQQPAYL